MFIFVLVVFVAAAYPPLPTPTSPFSAFDSAAWTLYSQYIKSLTIKPPECFNYTLLTTVESHFSKNLSQDLQIYSKSHAKHLQGVPIIQYSFKRWLGHDVNISDYLDDDTRQGFLDRE